MKPWYRTKSPLLHANHADAAESAFVESTLKGIAAELSEKLIPELKGMRFVPMDTSIPPGAVTYAYRMITRTGIAQIIGSRGDDIPMADLFMQEFVHKFHRFGAGYQYTWDDLLASQFASQNGGPPISVDTEKGRAAQEAISRGFDRIAATGTSTGMGADPGLVGLANHPNATTYTIPNGAAGSPLWSLKTPDEVVADLFGIAASQSAGSYEVYQVAKYLLPTLQHRAILGRRMGDGSDETILGHFMETQRKAGMPVTVESWQPLATAGSGQTARMIAYNPQPKYVRHVVSDVFTQMPPQLRNLVYVILCIAKSAGIVAPHPGSISYGDGIG